jgi:hypothetical protein
VLRKNPRVPQQNLVGAEPFGALPPVAARTFSTYTNNKEWKTLKPLAKQALRNSPQNPPIRRMPRRVMVDAIPSLIIGKK